MKIFCIGLTKTGTTSFHSLATTLGYKTQGYSKQLLREYLELGGIGPKIERAIEQNDAFEDWPWPFLYRYLLERFQHDSAFVLTKRSSPEVWINSIKRYALNSRTQLIRKATYGTEFPHGFEDHYLERYRSRLVEVRDHFKCAGAMNQLLEVEAGDPRLLEFVCRVRNIETPDCSLPHKQKSALRPKVAAENLKSINRTLLGLGKRPLSLEEAGQV